MANAGATAVWVGNFGDYPIPACFSNIRMTRAGMPDRRCTGWQEFLGWVFEQDERARMSSKTDASGAANG